MNYSDVFLFLLAASSFDFFITCNSLVEMVTRVLNQVFGLSLTYLCWSSVVCELTCGVVAMCHSLSLVLHRNGTHLILIASLWDRERSIDRWAVGWWEEARGTVLWGLVVWLLSWRYSCMRPELVPQDSMCTLLTSLGSVWTRSCQRCCRGG